MFFSDKLLSSKAKALQPYVAGLQPQDCGWVKLNTNENPYPPSPKVLDAIKNINISKLCLYPDGDSFALKKAIADDVDLAPENIFCGNGSDEVLALAFQAFFSGKTNIHTPDISYGFYPVWGNMYDAKLIFHPVTSNFAINPDDYVDAKGVILANPNAPTSLALELDQIEQILLRSLNGVVLVDEAYIDFANVKSAVALLKKYENLLLVRTFSKSHSLAGMRVGYAIGHPFLINALKLVRDSFNSYPLDTLAQTIAIAAIKDRGYLLKTCSQVIETRDKIILRLHELGYHVLPSQTNFILIKTQSAKELYDYLLKNKVLTRYWDKPRLSNYLRVSIGTNEDMEVFYKCVREFTTAKQTKLKSKQL